VLNCSLLSIFFTCKILYLLTIKHEVFPFNLDGDVPDDFYGAMASINASVWLCN
jgi:hypothetical protein